MAKRAGRKARKTTRTAKLGKRTVKARAKRMVKRKPGRAKARKRGIVGTMLDTMSETAALRRRLGRNTLEG
jgi:hypothetical protein